MMKDLKVILSEFKKIDLTLRKAALATVVRVRGSSYRSPGARMLITDDGKWYGSISGGCLEGDALRKARQVMSEGIAITVIYDTNEESNQNLGISLGCNGIIDVLIEPLNVPNAPDPLAFIEQIVAIREPQALATIFAGEHIGQKIRLTQSGAIQGSFTQPELKERVVRDLSEVFETKRCEAKHYSFDQRDADVFIELIQPAISLIIFGGGFDARPVAQLAKSVGWDVTVTDECVAHIAPIFFPGADTLALCKRERIEHDFEITHYTACILMSHNYEYDRDVLQRLLTSPTPYIGILGPRKRFEKMKEEFAERKVNFSEDNEHRVHSPIGIDIGAEAADEIAIAIIAEIQATFANRSGGFLKHLQGPIHPRSAEDDQVIKQIYLA